jgi:putative oxidoreductase
MPQTTRFSDHIYAILRLIIGFLFACHGAQKLFGVLGGQQMLHGKFLVAGIIEFAGGVMIATGLLTRLAAFFACGEMAVAYFTVHAHGGFFPIVNKGELAVAYCFCFLYFLFYGSGPWSVDNLLFRRGSKQRASAAGTK